MDVTGLDYALPPEAIAQVPAEPRDHARLLVAVGGVVDDRHVRDLPAHVRAGDVIVVNRTRVLPARLRLRKPSGGAVEVLLLEPAGDRTWEALVRHSRRIPEGTVLEHEGEPVAVVGERLDGRRLVRLVAGDQVVHAIGEMPLPPYIAGSPDPDRYQTVYARADVARSVAAPTAGLHLTPETFDACIAAGARIEHVDLDVGLGTFKAITAERVEDHVMHSERYEVPQATLDACAGAGRVIAVGTTTVRALESAARGRPTGRTDLFIAPGFDFRVVDLLMTNFHMPRTSLLAMLEAFTGPRWRDLYAHALASGYRFLSFGDAMLVDRA